MNKNIDKAMSEILESSELREKLVWQRSLDDTYAFCKSVSGGYTKKEFEEFLSEIFDYDEHLCKEVDDEEMANVAGGANKNMYSKILSYSLSFLVMATSGSVGAASTNSGETISATRTWSEKTSKESFWSKYKAAIISMGVTGLAALVAYAALKKGDDGTTTAAQPGAYSSHGHGAEQGPDGEEIGGKYSYTKLRRKYDSFKESVFSIPVIGPALGLIGVATYIIYDLGSILKQIAKIQNASWTVQQLLNTFADWRKSIENHFNPEELSVNDALDNLKYLFDDVRGQEKAKEQIRSIVFGILHRKNQAKLAGKKYDRADVLYFVGPSGVGKTLMAEGLAKYKVLTNSEPFYISASEVDKDSKESVIAQLFGYGNYSGGGYSDDYSSREGNRVSSGSKNLVRYINNNPNGLVIIDEYDKMQVPGLDEFFRTAMDHGVVKGIDCSGITFILTSNESIKAIRGGNQEEEPGKDIDDGTGSRTWIKHDKSFLNRLQPVEFNNLSAKEYSEIISKEFKDQLVDYWVRPDVGGIDIVIDDKCLKDMSKLVEKKNQGARYSVKLQSDLFRDISMKVFDANVKEKDFYRGKKIFVKFNSDKEIFTLKDEEKTSPKTGTTTDSKVETPVIAPAEIEVN